MTDLNTPHIVVTGNPVDGLTFTGPFDNHDDALMYAETRLTGDYWWVAPIEAADIEPQGTGEYQVLWQTRVLASSPREAAIKAHQAQLAQEPIFEVTALTPGAATETIELDGDDFGSEGIDLTNTEAPEGGPDGPAAVAARAARTGEVWMHPALAETLPVHTDELPTATQPAFHAVVHLLVPGVNDKSEPMDETWASDWISETLRDRFLDWGYVRDAFDLGTMTEGDLQTPVRIEVLKPYVEGTFLSDEDEPSHRTVTLPCASCQREVDVEALSSDGLCGRCSTADDDEGQDAIVCTRHGGPWGEDPTCEHCTDEDGNPRSPYQPGPLGPGAE